MAQEPLPDRKGDLERPYSPTSSRTSRIRRVLLRESGNTQRMVSSALTHADDESLDTLHVLRSRVELLRLGLGTPSNPRSIFPRSPTGEQY